MVEDFRKSCRCSTDTENTRLFLYSFSLIMPKSGVLRIENYLRRELEQEDDNWAKEAKKRRQKDMRPSRAFL